MKAGWKTKSFEDCIEKVAYPQKIQRKDFLANGAYPIISQEEEFINGYWDDEADLFNVTTSVVVFGDHTKVLKYVDFNFVLGADGVKILQPREFLSPKFFFYQLDLANLDSLGYARHYKLLRELEIAYPARSEQERIVAILDEAFEGIAQAKAIAEKNLANARALFDSYLQSVFTQRAEGWVNATIGETCILKSGTTVSPTLEWLVGDIPYLKVADMTFDGNDDRITTSSRFLKKADVKKSSIIPKGATIFPKRGGAILTNRKRLTLVPICADLNIMAVLPSARLEPKLLYFYFLNVDMRKLGTGSSIPQINNYDIAPLPISFPESNREQRVIIEKLEELRAETQRLTSLYERKLVALQALKQSLLHQAFVGELTARTQQLLQEAVA